MSAPLFPTVPVRRASALDRPRERETLFVPSAELRRILYWSAVAACVLSPLYLGISTWLALGAAISVFATWHTLSASRRIPWIPGLTTCAACVQWIIAPWIVYGFPHMGVLAIPVAADTYFGYFVPATVALMAGMYLPLLPYGRLRKVTAVTGFQIPRRMARLCDAMVIGGLVVRILVVPIVPGSVRFAFVLIGNLSFVGAIGVTLVGVRRWYLRVGLVLLVEAGLNSASAQFLDLMLWCAFLAVTLIFRFRVRGRTIIMASAAGLMALFAINGIKGSYRLALERTDVPLAQRPSMVATSFMNMISTPSKVFSLENVATNINRLNEGWIAGRVLVWVPEFEPYAGGETIITALRSVFVPRFFDPGKVEAGGRVNVPRFTGLELVLGTSMNLSIPGEMYANFGAMGGVIATFVFGLMLGWIFRLFVRWGRASLMWFAWAPYILFAAVSAEMGVVEVLNTVAKAFIIAAAVVLIFPEWGRLLPWRLRSRRRAE